MDNVSVPLLMVLAAFDLTLVVLFYLFLRAHGPVDRRFLIPLGAGLAGFVFHAFLFFGGAILYLQLATIIGIFALYVSHSRKPA